MRLFSCNAPIAQQDRARRYERRGPGFESWSGRRWNPRRRESPRHDPRLAVAVPDQLPAPMRSGVLGGVALRNATPALPRRQLLCQPGPTPGAGGEHHTARADGRAPPGRRRSACLRGACPWQAPPAAAAARRRPPRPVSPRRRHRHRSRSGPGAPITSSARASGRRGRGRVDPLPSKENPPGCRTARRPTPCGAGGSARTPTGRPRPGRRAGRSPPRRWTCGGPSRRFPVAAAASAGTARR